MTINADADRLRVEVFDGDTLPPVLLAADNDATSGRGMQIIAAAADRWGYESDERDGINGKTVWAEFSLAAP